MSFSERAIDRVPEIVGTVGQGTDGQRVMREKREELDEPETSSSVLSHDVHLIRRL